MNKKFRFALFLILIHLLHPSSVLSGQIIINSDEQFLFAKQYMDKGEYNLAIGEFKRFIHFFPEDEKVPEAHYFIGVCHLKAKKYDSARKVLGNVYKNYSKTPLAGKALFLIGESYYKQGILNEAERYYKIVIEKYPHKELSNAALYRLGWSQMQGNKWQEASETFKMMEKNSPLYASSQDLSEKSLKGEHLPYKDPTTAGVMAGLVPGLGHAYSNRYKDGLVAFLLNGLFIWAAYESFEQDHDVLGGILSFMELGWYSGNIYSAVNSVHKYNRKIRNDFRRSLPENLNLHLFTTRDRHVGLALRIDF